MKLNKRLLGTKFNGTLSAVLNSALCSALAVALCAQFSFAVLADDEATQTINSSVYEMENTDDSSSVDTTADTSDDSSEITEESTEGSSKILTIDAEDMSFDNTVDPDYKENDPGYLKYINSQTRARAAYGSKNLTHQSRFASVDKQYGIDVSYYQSASHEIDWNEVKNDDVEYVIVRVGYRGYGSAGTLVIDQDFHKNMKGAIAAGLKVGVYFYTQAINTTEAKAEANLVLGEIKNYKLDLPVYYDIEGVDYDTGRLDSAGLSKAQKTALCTAFCDTIQNAGYTAGVYANYSWLQYSIDGASLGQKYKIWLAHFTTYTDYPNTFDMWQYSSVGYINGIVGGVDMNVKYVTDPHPQGDINLTYTTNGTTAKLSWSSVSNNVGYIVFRKNSAGVSERLSVIKSTSTTSYSFTLPSDSYTYYVRPYNIYKNKNYYGSYSNEVSVIKGRPGNLKATAYTQNTVTLNWNSISGADGYLVYARAVGGSYRLKAKVKTNSCTVANLSTATFYGFKVKPYYTAGSSTDFISGTSEKGIASLPLTQPTKAETGSGLSLSSYGTSTITLKWNKAAKLCNGYVLSYYNSSSKTYSVITTTTSTSYTVSGLKAGTSYSFAVKPFYNYGSTRIDGEYSSALAVSTAPSNVTNLSLVSFNSNSAQLSWSAVSGATNYQVFKYQNGYYSLVTTTAATTATVSNLSLGSSYTYCIRPLRSVSGNYYGSYGNKLTFAFNHSAPSELSPYSTYTASSTSVQWTSVIGATGYQIYKLDETSGEYKLAQTVSNKTTTYIPSGLKASTGYTYKVRAVFGTSYSSFTDPVTVYTKPTVPTNFRVITTSSDYLRLQWDLVPNANYYRVYIYNATSGNYEIYKDVHSDKVRITDLKASTTYKFKIKAIIDAKKNYLSDYSSILSAKTSN